MDRGSDEAHMLTHTPEPPYYAAIVTSLPTFEKENSEYKREMQDLLEDVQSHDGFLGMDLVHGEMIVLISYWDSLRSIQNWKMNTHHANAQTKGKMNWYRDYKTRICKVEYEY